ncbi:hypothetical protein BVG16_05370 [Paenibacillus selenitireducens]|uniref:DUF3794 domain-containing protein n=1 Tax=Paenibacillus selenitireducens TaxID=1324314 RepID=A0A1T2XKC4_9BACL|nr:hypothetical protein [Paenibacillus selenitireducens]OPA80176.1 hypothetical protein BVG16_05370 [Paenibacillus selenitireducens]
MERKLVQGQQTSPEYLPLPSLECIQVPKIFDWIVKVTQIVDESTIDPAACLPLPSSFSVSVELTSVQAVEKPGSVRENVVVTIGGTTLTLQRVVIRKTGTYLVTITDTSVVPNVVHCTYTKSFVRFEKVLLCAPPGTDVDVTVIPSGTTIEVLDVVDNTLVNVDINICQSIQVTAIVKLMVEAELCQPRADIPIPENPCVVTFPHQCPAIFPGHPYPFAT